MITKNSIRRSVAVVILFMGLTPAENLAGQTTIGVLPVDITSVDSTVLTARQWQGISQQMHDYLVMQLAGIGTVSKLSREHVLLLLKELPAPDPDNPDAGAIRIICKKEKLEYLIKCSIEAINTNGKKVTAPLKVVIFDGISGKVFWENVVSTSRTVSSPELNEQIMLNEVIKPSVNDITEEIKNLNL